MPGGAVRRGQRTHAGDIRGGADLRQRQVALEQRGGDRTARLELEALCLKFGQDLLGRGAWQYARAYQRVARSVVQVQRQLELQARVASVIGRG